MKLTREQKLMFGVPVMFSAGLCSMVIPIALAARSNNPLWLLLWIVGAVVTGAVCMAVKGWTDNDG